MDPGLFAQYVMNGLMLGMMYALVAVGFTLFFGVLDVIKFSHGDVLTVGAFTALATFAGLQALGLRSQWLDLVVMLALATLAIAGVMNGLYYNEVNFGTGLYLGVVGFSAAIIGGLGSIYGAILGGFLFAGLQTIGTVLLPFASAYKDVFAFAVVIAIMAWRPTGLIQEKISERV